MLQSSCAAALLKQNTQKKKPEECNSLIYVPLQVSVVLAVALPFLSLSFGYVPTKHELDTAAQIVQMHAEEFNGWEISSLIWAAARLGYRPADSVMHTLLQQVRVQATSSIQHSIAQHCDCSNHLRCVSNCKQRLQELC